MPAYRSPAEAEVRDAVEARLRSIRPMSRIIHEINVSGHGSNRIDLIAVGIDEIIAVEVKSAKDKLDRLPTQIKAMKGVAHHVVAAIHDKFLIEKATNQWAAHYQRGEEYFCRDAPVETKGASVWVYPEVKRSQGTWDDLCPWRAPQVRHQLALPSDAIWMLWRDELYELCGALRISVGRRATMTDMARELRWLLPGGELTKGICAALRARKCIEADAPIIDEAKAAVAAPRRINENIFQERA
jgi:hypothetical protein